MCYAFRITSVRPAPTFHDRLLKQNLGDPGFRAEFERARREIAAIDEIVNGLDELREQLGLSKAELARAIGKDPASVRRLLSAPANPELRTVISVADALDADIVLKPRGTKVADGKRRQPRRATRSGTSQSHHPEVPVSS